MVWGQRRLVAQRPAAERASAPPSRLPPQGPAFGASPGVSPHFRPRSWPRSWPSSPGWCADLAVPGGGSAQRGLRGQVSVIRPRAPSSLCPQAGDAVPRCEQVPCRARHPLSGPCGVRGAPAARSAPSALPMRLAEPRVPHHPLLQPLLTVLARKGPRCPRLLF